MRDEDKSKKQLISELTESRKRYENELNKSEKKFRILLESASQAIILVNMHGRITLVNAKVESLFLYKREELIDQPIEILIPARLRELHVKHRNEYILNPVNRKLGVDFSINARQKDGSEFPAEISLSGIDICEGLFVMAFITDISERKKFESKLRQIEKLEAVGQLAGGIAHDFNNVLAVIIGLAELGLRKLPKNNAAQENLKQIIMKADSAANLVRQLLIFSRKQFIKPQKLNLNYTIKNNKKLLQRYLGEDVELITKLENSLSFINADPSSMDQIITNLCINARDAMPDGGDLILQTENVTISENIAANSGEITKGKFVKLSVCDSGMGMREEIINHIFEPFFTTKDIGEGTGLGLSIVYGLVKQHNGFIQSKSRLGEGTTFELYFPVFTDDLSNHTKNNKEQVKGGKETILVVDDEADLLKGFKTTLELLGYTVLAAQNGLKALAIIEQHKDSIDMIIADVVMPVMGGVELKLIVKKIDPDIKFIFISSYTDKVEPDEVYLQKPFQSDILARKVRKVLDTPLKTFEEPE